MKYENEFLIFYGEEFRALDSSVDKNIFLVCKGPGFNSCYRKNMLFTSVVFWAKLRFLSALSNILFFIFKYIFCISFHALYENFNVNSHPVCQRNSNLSLIFLDYDKVSQSQPTDISPILPNTSQKGSTLLGPSYLELCSTKRYFLIIQLFEKCLSLSSSQD